MQEGGTLQARLEREAAEANTRRRLASLDIGDTPLCFGRLDLAPVPPKWGNDGEAADPAADGPFYIGRISVTEDDLTPLVVDWRAPVAEPFYRATAVEPMGVARRRHFQTHGRRLIGLDDEVFDADTAETSGLTVVGEGALLAALDVERTGRMRDIVATIQAEQDEAIRAPLTGILVVAGGPGTGKTAVALHRAAYLLYSYRKRLGSQGVLLVGPSPIFLRYIDEVLPSLGEDEVVLATTSSLKPGVRARAVAPADVAAIKGDRRMARVIAGAISDRERPVPRDVFVPIDGYRLRMRRRDARRIVERARAARQPQRTPSVHRRPCDRSFPARVPARTGERLPRSHHGRRRHRRGVALARRTGSGRMGRRPHRPIATRAGRPGGARADVAHPERRRVGERPARVRSAHPIGIERRPHARRAAVAPPRARARCARRRVDRRRSAAPRRGRRHPRAEERGAPASPSPRAARRGDGDGATHGLRARSGRFRERGGGARALRLRLAGAGR